jgi:predicted SprT family Zn-dependent metalloprotease
MSSGSLLLTPALGVSSSICARGAPRAMFCILSNKVPPLAAAAFGCSSSSWSETTSSMSDGGSIGGAYVFHPGRGKHLILINLRRIDLSKPKSLEIVVCEELLHMRHRIDGDRRRHAKHGHDRIAVQVSELTGASMDEVRACVKPVKRRTPKYVYACPKCQMEVHRSRTGVWSCGRCSPTFDRRFELRLIRTADRTST